MAIEFGPKTPNPEPQKIRVSVTKSDPEPIKVYAVTKREEPAEARAVVVKYVVEDLHPSAKKGRPVTGNAKKAVTIRLDQDVVKALESREDWRSEVNALLRRHLGL